MLDFLLILTAVLLAASYLFHNARHNKNNPHSGCSSCHCPTTTPKNSTRTPQ